MNDKLKSIFATTIILVSFLTAGAFAQEFSADVINTSKDGSFRGKIYVTKEKVRMEIPQSIMITRLDKNVMWILMPQEKMYMEQSIDLRNIVATSEGMPGEVERKLIGQEVIEGRTTDKYQVTYSYEGRTNTVFVWIDHDSTIPVKTMAADGSWTMEYRDLQVGSQAADLFELPAGYQKMSSEMPRLENMPAAGDIPQGLGEESLE